MSISLQGSLICEWFVDPDLPEAHALRERYIALNGNISQPIWHGFALPAPEPEQTDVAALAAVTNPHTIYSKKYVIDVKIKCLKPNQSWWYHACAAWNRHATPDGDVYKCSVLRCTSTRSGPRYCLLLIAIDPASSLRMAMIMWLQLNWLSLVLRPRSCLEHLCIILLPCSLVLDHSCRARSWIFMERDSICRLVCLL
ncbi:hypothetical protein BS78_06G059000 [Paspalum vaginatum]|nr:hypothetical protein BS78_06G059000 [Paspalum vaginatum]